MRPTFLLFISATPSPAEPARRADPTFVLVAEVINGPSYKYVGCRNKGALTQDKTVAGFTVESCMHVCYDNQYKWGGVGNNKCYCDEWNGGVVYPPVSEKQCKHLTCPGDSTEYCGSTDSIILYGS